MTALGAPNLPWVAGASVLAGLVYGFAGFGAALIFMPLTTVFISAPVAIAAFSVSALASLITVVPGAWKVADRRAVAVMIGGCLICAPLGVAILRLAPDPVIRAVIAALTLGTLAVLIAGWRVPARGGWPVRAGVGALSGITGGATGLNGPPVILFNLATDQPVAVTRGNLAVFLTLTSLGVLPQLWLQGMLRPQAVWLGLILLIPYSAGTWCGVRLFNPRHAVLYRCLAYGLIGAAGLAALPGVGPGETRTAAGSHAIE